MRFALLLCLALCLALCTAMLLPADAPAQGAPPPLEDDGQTPDNAPPPSLYDQPTPDTGVLNPEALAQGLDSLMERLGVLVNTLGGQSKGLEEMYRMDKYNGRAEGSCLLALSWVAEAAFRTAHDTFMTVSALQAEPDMVPEAYLFIMLELRQSMFRVQHTMDNLSDLEDLQPSPEDRPLLDELCGSLRELADIYDQLDAIFALSS